MSGSPISVTYLDDGVDTLITNHCEALISKFDKHTTELKSTPLKDYNGNERLNQLVKHTVAHLEYNEQFLQDMINAFSTARKSLDSLNSTLIEKIREEDLESWLDRPLKDQGKISTCIENWLRLSSSITKSWGQCQFKSIQNLTLTNLTWLDKASLDTTRDYLSPKITNSPETLSAMYRVMYKSKV